MKKQLFHVISWLFLITVIGCDSNTSENQTIIEEASDEELTLAQLGLVETEELPEGLPFGSKVPGIGARDVEGKQIDLYSMLKEGPLVVTFYRGKWCSNCKNYLSNIRDSLAMIRHMGAKVIAVTPEKRENANEMFSQNELNFSLISDYGNNIMNAFKVTFKVNKDFQKKILEKEGYSIAENNGTTEAFLPVPATYIIDKTGTIVYKHFDYDYRKRPSVAELMDALKNIP